MKRKKPELGPRFSKLKEKAKGFLASVKEKKPLKAAAGLMDKNRLMPLLTRLLFTARMAAHGILSKRLRSGLTILGVAIGVASVVSLMGIGEGARRAVIEQFESLGSDVVIVKAHDPNFEFDPAEADELLERVQGLEMATPIVQTDATITWRRSKGKADILGTNNEFPEIRDHEIISGHFFSSLHVAQRSPVAVLGYELAQGLLAGRSPVGQSMSIAGQSYRIIGVLAPKGAGKAENIDYKIIIPYTTAQKLAEKRTVEEIWAKASSSTDADLAIVQMGRIFRRKLGLDQSAPTPSAPGEEGPEEVTEARAEVIGGGGMAVTERAVPSSGQSRQPILPEGGDDAITITSLNQMVEEADNANRIMTLLLGGIAAVSLLVGGLGIMNIMLVAVTERTEEIGVRRALGAKREDLLMQFLMEALYLSLIGAVTGVAAGVWGVSIFKSYGFETVVSFQAIRIATLVAVVSGLLFGVYPAVSASSVPPVEALRRQ
ncbi:MAG: ABC transporter permease [Clostridia bacterium]|jgi:putative ABC transport system permease protein